MFTCRDGLSEGEDRECNGFYVVLKIPTGAEFYLFRKKGYDR